MSPEPQGGHAVDAPVTGPSEVGHAPSVERQRALARGRAFRLAGSAPASESHLALCRSNPALAALAENVRDYAIFLLDPRGIIMYWGAGAHLMKWWTAEEAEGAHLALLYLDAGSEDGTAEAHLREAETSGEYVGEGQRVRRDGSTFWAGVTLTALRDPEGLLLGFGKLTRDLTALRAQEAMLAGANAVTRARDVALALVQREQAARARAEETAEFAQAHLRGAREYISQVLEPELAAEREQNRELMAQVRASTAQRDREDAARDLERG